MELMVMKFMEKLLFECVTSSVTSSKGCNSVECNVLKITVLNKRAYCCILFSSIDSFYVALQSLSCLLPNTKYGFVVQLCFQHCRQKTMKLNVLKDTFVDFVPMNATNFIMIL